MLKAFAASLLMAGTGGGGIAAASMQAAAASPLLGIWNSEDGSFRLKMFYAGGSYAGRMLYGRRVMEADDRRLKRDIHIPDPALRSRSLQNAVVLKDLKRYGGNRRWEGGILYDGSFRRTYSARDRLKNGRLEMRGYMGSPMLGRTVTFNRIAG